MTELTKIENVTENYRKMMDEKLGNQTLTFVRIKDDIFSIVIGRKLP